MPQRGSLTRNVTKKECPWLERDLPSGKEVYEYDGHTYGVISPSGVAVSDKPDTTPFYELPADSVSWNAMSNTLVLPTDPARVAQLKAKLAEYETRLERDCQEDDPRCAWNSICKIAVLKTLLDDGCINLDLVRGKLAREHGEAVSRLLNAFEVITDYCTTGGKNTHGGTGLKNPADLVQS